MANKEGVTPSKYGVKKTMASPANGPDYGGKVKPAADFTKLPVPPISKNSLQGYSNKADKRHKGEGPNWNNRRPKSIEKPYKGPAAPVLPKTHGKPACASSYQGKPID